MTHGVLPVPPQARNARCACGSGRRYKDCCGGIAKGAEDARSAEPLLHAAGEAFRHRRFDEARQHLERARASAPLPADAEAVLGAILLRAGDYAKALRTLRQACLRMAEVPAATVVNLAGAVAGLLATRAPLETERLWLDYVATRPRASAGGSPRHGRISVVVPSHNHAAFIGAALESVLAQTRAADEIVVIDDGSTDGSPDLIGAMAARSGGRIRFVARENRGAATTINEAVAATTGDWINILNSDDAFTADRLAAMEAGVAAAGASWGFSRCTFVDADGRAILDEASPHAARQREAIDRAGALDTVGMAFVGHNPATSTGTLYFSRPLFDRLGGFRDLRYVHDWDFCLRACLLAEPAFVPQSSYLYRIHGRNTLSGANTAPNDEALSLTRAFLRTAEACRDAENPYAPIPAVWGRSFALRAIECGAAPLLDASVVFRLADELLDELPA
ncbi:MAG: glycosyltransferase [Betaproteobacteria bacterium]